MRKLLCLLLLPIVGFGAIGATAVWEVRSTGASTNGGFYTSGGTDWSQQDAAQYAVTDAVTAGTTTITSATANFGTDIVGNGCYITGGTGSLAAVRRQVASRTNSTTIVMDASTGLGASTGTTLNCGGGADHPSTINSAVVAGNTIYVKASATYTTAATITFGNGSAGLPIIWIGYTTTRTDAGKWTLQSTNDSATPVLSAGSFNVIKNFTIDGNSHTGRGITVGSGNTKVENCEVKNVAGSDIAFYMPGDAMVTSCWVHANTALSSAAVYMAAGTMLASVVNANTINSGGWSVRMTIGGLTFAHNIVASNTSVSGTANPGIYCDSNCRIYANTIHANAGNGIETTTSGTGISAWNNIITNNGGFAIKSSGAISDSLGDYNAIYNNTGGTYSNVLAGTHDVTLTGLPYTNAGSLDFSLNNTASQGAACRAAAFPGVFLGVSTTAYYDIGAVQHQDSGGSSGTRSCASQ